MRNLFRDINATPSLAFVVHDGDLGGSDAIGCTDEQFEERLALFQSSVHPLIYTPGDNEWTDCHARGFDPVERLNRLRGMFFADEFSLGQQRIQLVRQSDGASHASYRENARWTMGAIAFLTVNVPGSNNNLGRTPEMDDEWAERLAADLDWLNQGFVGASQAGSRGVVVIWQGNPRFERQPDENAAYAPLLEALEDHAVAFDRPVLLVHGDTHYFRVDKPLPIGGPPGRVTRGRNRIDNFTRVETFGEPDWLSVLVDYADPNLFVVRQRIVEQNRGCAAPPSPC